MDEKDKKNLETQVAEDKEELKEQKEELESKEAMNEEMQEEIRNFAETSPEMGPSNWNQGGTWWILAIAGILIVFLVIWVCFFYGPN